MVTVGRLAESVSVPLYTVVTVARYTLPAVIVPESAVETVHGDRGEVIAEASEEEAANTVAFVFALTFEVSPVMAEANDEEAARTVELVLELTAEVPEAMADAREVEALSTLALVVLIFVPTVASVAPRLVEARSVWALTEDVAAAIWELVLALMFEAKLVDAAKMAALVLALMFEASEVLAFKMAEANEEDAAVTSDCVASGEPLPSRAEVRARPAPVV